MEAVMTGESHWLPIVWMLVGGVGILAFMAATQRALRHLRAEERQVICPNQQRAASAVVVTDARTGQPTGVTRCSALRNPDNVDCAKSCVIPC